MVNFFIYSFLLLLNVNFAGTPTQPQDLEKARTWRNDQVRLLNNWHSTQLQKMGKFETQVGQWLATERALAKRIPIPPALEGALKEITTEGARLQKHLRNASEILSKNYNSLFSVIHKYPLYPPQAEFNAFTTAKVGVERELENSFAAEWKKHLQQYQSLAVLFEPVIDKPPASGTLENLSQFQEKQLFWVVQKNGKEMAKGPEQDAIAKKISILIAGSDVFELSTNEDGDLLYKGEKIQLRFYYREGKQSKWYDEQSQVQIVEKLKRQAREILDHRRQIAAQQPPYQRQQAALKFWSRIIAILKHGGQYPLSQVASHASVTVEEKKQENSEPPIRVDPEPTSSSVLPNSCTGSYRAYPQSANLLSLHSINSEQGEQTIGFFQRPKMIACSGDSLALVSDRFYFEGKTSVNINSQISNASVAELARGEARGALLLFGRGGILRVILKPRPTDFMWLATEISKDGTSGFRVWRLGDKGATFFLSSDGQSFERELFKDPNDFGYRSAAGAMQSSAGGDL